MTRGGVGAVYIARNPLLFGVLELAETFGASREGILGEIGLAPPLLEGVGARVPAHMLSDAIECAAKRTGRKDFGLLLGTRQDHRLLGPLGLLIEQAETFSEALKFATRYFHLHNTSLHDTLVRQRSQTWLRTDIRAKGQFEPRHYAEMLLVMRVRFARLFLGPKWLPGSALLKHEQLSSRATYASLLGPNVSFRQRMNAIGFTTAELNRRSTLREPEVRRRLEVMLEELDTHQSDNSIAKVSELLRTLLPLGRGTIEELASLMATTPRTLQRQFSDRNLHFKDILADVRLEMANEYLRGGAFTAAQVAPLLGFSESSALSRFLRSHAGKNVRDIRKSGR